MRDAEPTLRDLRERAAWLLDCAATELSHTEALERFGYASGMSRGAAGAYRLAALWLLEDIGDHEQAAALAYWMGVTPREVAA